MIHMILIAVDGIKKFNGTLFLLTITFELNFKFHLPARLTSNFAGSYKISSVYAKQCYIRKEGNSVNYNVIGLDPAEVLDQHPFYGSNMAQNLLNSAKIVSHFDS